MAAPNAPNHTEQREGMMAKDDTAGYADVDQKADQLAALKVEYEGYKQLGDDDRAKQVAAYAKEYHGASFTSRGAAAKAEE